MQKVKKKERNLFSVRAQTQPKTKRKKDDAGEQEEKKQKIFSSVDTEPLTYNSLVEGQLILGCISECRDFDLVVSLPHSIVGYIPITNISKSFTKLLSRIADEEDVDEKVLPLHNLYTPGQCVITKVHKLASTNNKIKVSLSIMPKHVNAELKGFSLAKNSLIQCAVCSTEDNGYIMETGLSIVRSAFLPKSEAPEDIAIGSVLSCLISNINREEDAVTIKLTANDERINTQNTEDESPGHSLVPGTIIKATVKAVLSEAILVKVGSSEGVIRNEHLLSPYDDHSKYSIGQTLEARVLFVSFLSHVIHLSINQALCQKGTLPNPTYDIGSTISDAVVRKTGKSGVYVKLTEKSFGFCSGNHCKDGPISKFNPSKSFPVGSVKPCRIMQFSWIDQIYIIGLKKSIIEEKVLGLKDLEIGQILKVSIKQHVSSGAIVAMSQHMDGYVPKIHLTESNMANPEKKCPVGKIISARVLKIEERRRPHLTLKSSLVNSEIPILKEVSRDDVGTWVEGTVVKISMKGLLMEFFNNLKGFVPKKSTGLESLNDLAEAFKIGQVVKCQIMKVYEDDGILLSMIDAKEFGEKKRTEHKVKEQMVKDSLKGKRKLSEGEETNSESKEIFLKKIGAYVVNCRISSIENDVVHAESDLTTTPLEIPMYHLSDDLAMCKTIFNLLKKGDTINNSIIFGLPKDKIILSLKPSVCQWASERLKQNGKLIDSISVKEIFPCVVQSVDDEKIKVDSATGKFGLTHNLYRSNIVDGSLRKISSLDIKTGQTLTVQCLRLPEEWKAVVSSKFKHVLTSIQGSSCQLLLNYLHNYEMVRHGFQRRGGFYHQLSEFRIGDVVHVEVKKNIKLGFIGVVRGTDINCIIPKEHTVDNIVNKEIKAKILHVNFTEQCLELTAKYKSKKIISTSEHGLDVGDTGKAKILLIKHELIVAKMLSLSMGQVIYIPTKRHFNDFTTMCEVYTVDSTLQVIIKYTKGEVVIADPVKGSSTDSRLVLLRKMPKIYFCDSDDEAAESAQFSTNIFKRVYHSKRDSKHKLCDRYKLPQYVGSSKKIKTKETKKKKKEKVLSLQSGFIWDEKDAEGTKDEKVETKLMKMIEEEKLLTGHEPTDSIEFDQLLRDHPNLSSMWIKYADYCIENSDIQKAKDILRKGIGYIEGGQSGFSLWEKLLKIEVSHGSNYDVQIAMKEASDSHDPVKLQMKLADIYADVDKLQEAERCLKALLKTFPTRPESWLAAASFNFKFGDLNAGRTVMDRSLQSLDNKEHVDILLKFSQLELLHGEAAKARSLLESLVDAFPKRLELWDEYRDLLLKMEDIKAARALLKRMCSLELPLEEMKSIFLKMEDFEMKYGTEKRIKAVKEMAANYLKTIVNK